MKRKRKEILDQEHVIYMSFTSEKNYMEWIESLEDNKEAHNSIEHQEASTTDIQGQDIEEFSSMECEKRGEHDWHSIYCLRQYGIILAKISKCKNGNAVRLVEVIAVKEALELAVHCG